MLKKILLALLLPIGSLNSMELPEALDQKAFDEDYHQMQHTLIETIDQFYGEKTFPITSAAERTSFLDKFKGSWKKGCLAPLTYTFDSYMKRVGIDEQWFEELIKQNQIEPSEIKVSQFVPLALERFKQQLSKYKIIQ